MAPSISSQFTYAKLGQVITGHQGSWASITVVEAALGADMVAYARGPGAGRKGLPHQLLLPGLCRLYRKAVSPSCKPYVSHNLSPMADHCQVYQGAPIRTRKIVFIGPCTAKKMEFQKESVRPYIDCVHYL